MSEQEAKETPHDELCDMALEHYDEISTEAMHSNSLIPRAIEYYKRWRPRGERKIIRTPRMLDQHLEEGWVFDPWLNPMGRPLVVGTDELAYYWVVVRGSPERIAQLEPFVDLPEIEEEEEPEPEFKPYGLETLFIAYGEKDASGDAKKPPKGYVIMHKDHIYAKGTVYTKRPGRVSTAWDVAKALAELSSHLGVDEAHDVIQGILNKEFKSA